MVMIEPVVDALRRNDPHSPIDLLAPEPVLELARRMTGVDRAITLTVSPHQLALTARRRIANGLRGQYARAFVVPNSFVSALIPALAGIPHRQGFVGEARFGLLTRPRRKGRADRPFTYLNYQRLADVTATRPPRLVVDEAQAATLRARHGLAGRRIAALFPGADGGTAKRWPTAHFVALGRLLGDLGFSVAVLGGERDRDLTAAIAGQTPAAVDLGGKTTLLEAIDLIAGAELAVGNDTGLMHVAAATGVAVAGLFGPTSARTTPPLSERSLSLTNGVPCAPCYRRECPLGHHDCLAGLRPEQVIHALTRHGLILGTSP